ncbi:MAG: hypothetical protein K9L17_12775 [Clostridiales bacterium]|nr:hypothetical protein [Clostridiales bacterium]MCF8023553.1 hypothetical protein [Clostridiales bacterium]
MAQYKHFQNILTSRERVRRAIYRKDVDRVPTGEILIDDAVISEYLGCGEVQFKEKHKFINELGQDIICLGPEYSNTGNNLPSVNDFIFPGLKNWVFQTNVFTFAVLDGVFGWGNKLWGFYDFITLPFKSPLAFESFVAQVENLNIELEKHLLDNGIDGIILADDIAYNGGLIISPELLKRYIFPSLTRQVKKVNFGDVPAFFHSDGNINTIMSDIIGAGFSGIHCIDRNSNMCVFDLQSKYGKKLCFWGNLDVKDVDYVSDTNYMQELKNSVDAAFSREGFILGTSSGIFNGLDINRLFFLYKKLVHT